MIEPVKDIQLTGDSTISITAVRLIFNELIEAHNKLEATVDARTEALIDADKINRDGVLTKLSKLEAEYKAHRHNFNVIDGDTSDVPNRYSITPPVEEVK